MRPKIEADGGTWEAMLDSRDPHEGIRALIFNCVTNPLRAWHVIEVPAADIPDEERLAQLSSAELEALFRGSDPMDYIHDPTADPEHPGGHPVPPPPPGHGE